VHRGGRRVNDFSFEETEHVSLCEALDRVLNKGAVISGDLTISVANVDLLYLSLRVVLTSIETARKYFDVNTDRGIRPVDTPR
jgi:hypothetical protein